MRMPSILIRGCVRRIVICFFIRLFRSRLLKKILFTYLNAYRETLIVYGWCVISPDAEDHRYERETLSKNRDKIFRIMIELRKWGSSLIILITPPNLLGGNRAKNYPQSRSYENVPWTQLSSKFKQRQYIILPKEINYVHTARHDSMLKFKGKTLESNKRISEGSRKVKFEADHWSLVWQRDDIIIISWRLPIVFKTTN